MSVDASELRYVGFWLRVVATLIDTVLLVIATAPLNYLVYGTLFSAGGPFNVRAEFLISWLLPAAGTVGFWVWAQATPGKMAIHARIVDARTGANPTVSQYVIRYLGYFVSIVPLFLGVLEKVLLDLLMLPRAVGCRLGEGVRTRIGLVEEGGEDRVIVRHCYRSRSNPFHQAGGFEGGNLIRDHLVESLNGAEHLRWMHRGPCRYRACR